jgi:probable F420-dependent oxidoreductase
MKVDLFLPKFDLEELPRLARWAEETGFEALWVSETTHDPFIALTLAAVTTERILLGTNVAVAFARSPMVTAYISWDLQRVSRGRFILGLGPQVKAHLERRFSVAWERPGPRIREYVLALQAIWDCWQHGAVLDFRGQFYTFSLMPPFFNPGHIVYPRPPVFLAAVNPFMLRLSGKLAQGVLIHPVNSRTYLEQVAMPMVAEGLRSMGRSRQEFQVTVSCMLAVDGESRAEVRRQIGFYGSTPAYRVIFATHGWEELADRLRSLASRGRWDELESLVPDEVVNTLAVVGRPEEVAKLIRERYEGIADRVAIYGLPRPTEDAGFWSKLIGPNFKSTEARLA